MGAVEDIWTCVDTVVSTSDVIGGNGVLIEVRVIRIKSGVDDGDGDVRFPGLLLPCLLGMDGLSANLADQAAALARVWDVAKMRSGKPANHIGAGFV